MGKILQIMPAPAGMSVLCENRDPHPRKDRLGQVVPKRMPVACLALIEENGTTQVKPMVMAGEGVVELATEVDGFLCISSD